MKLVVDLTRCQGYAQCAFLAPDAFTMHGDGEALLYDPEPSDELRERVLRAAAACPGQALVLDPRPAENRAAPAAAAPAPPGAPGAGGGGGGGGGGGACRVRPFALARGPAENGAARAAAAAARRGD